MLGVELVHIDDPKSFVMPQASCGIMSRPLEVQHATNDFSLQIGGATALQTERGSLFSDPLSQRQRAPSRGGLPLRSRTKQNRAKLLDGIASASSSFPEQGIVALEVDRSREKKPLTRN